MINPLQPYTRHRDGSTVLSSATCSYISTQYNGTISDPWKVKDGYPTTGGFTRPTQQRFEMHDVVTPEWQKKRRMGVIVNNPMEQSIVTRNVESGPYVFYDIIRKGTYPNYYYTGGHTVGTMVYGDSFDTSYWTYPTALSLQSSDLIAEALTEAWSRVSLSETQIYVQLKELHKTYASLVSIFKRVLKIFTSLKKLRLKALLKEISPKELANRYMEARYALRPLMYDVRGCINAIYGGTLATRQTFRGFQRRIGEEAASNVVLRTTSNSLYRGSTLSTRTIEVRSGVLTNIESAFLLTHPSVAKWGMLEPFESIWEVIPFSFIIDWFFNVGKLIGSLSPNFGMKTLASWYVVTDTICLASVVESGEVTTGQNYNTFFNPSGKYSQVTVNKYRLPNPDRPLLPRFDLNIDSLKTLDLGIILSKLLKIW